MQLKPFRIERYYAQHEFSTRYMLSSSDCESRTIAELLAFEPDAERRLHDTWCGYTESSGAPELREAIAALYERAGADDVIVCSCAEEGIFLLYHALLGAGDHAIVETPCYESALELAAAPAPPSASGGAPSPTTGGTTSTPCGPRLDRPAACSTSTSPTTRRAR